MLSICNVILMFYSQTCVKSCIGVLKSYTFYQLTEVMRLSDC